MSPDIRTAVSVYASPIGPLTIAVHGGRVCLLHFDAGRDRVQRTLSAWYPDALLDETTDGGLPHRLLDRYFAGDLEALDRIEVEMHGTPFQRRVWDALRTIPAGRTASYSDIATRVGDPHAVRAVGTANGANPVAVIVPCHRVIGASGALTGYGGGLERKRWLLAHEGQGRLLF